MDNVVLKEALAAANGKLKDTRKIVKLVRIIVWCLLVLTIISVCIQLSRAIGLFLMPDTGISFVEACCLISGIQPSVDSFPLSAWSLFLNLFIDLANYSLLGMNAALLVWLYWTLKNLHNLGLRDNAYAPTRVVIYMLIPVWNFFHLHKYAQYAWRASIGLRQWGRVQHDKEIDRWCWMFIALVVVFSPCIWFMPNIGSTHGAGAFILIQVLSRIVYTLFHFMWTPRIIARITQANEQRICAVYRQSPIKSYNQYNTTHAGAAGPEEPNDQEAR